LCAKRSIYFFGRLIGLGFECTKPNTCQTAKDFPCVPAHQTLRKYCQDIYLQVIRCSSTMIACARNGQFISLADLLGLGSKVPINLPKKKIDGFAHKLSQTLIFWQLTDISLGNTFGPFCALERTGSPRLFGMYWVWVHSNPNPINLPKI
jgi:hypothetical protein